jgi:hypothetical protein
MNIGFIIAIVIIIITVIVVIVIVETTGTSTSTSGSSSGSAADTAGITAVANMPVGTSVTCSSNGTTGAFYRYMGNNSIAGYPTPQIAASWNPNWGSNASSIDCGGLTILPNLAMNPSINAPTASLPVTTNSYTGVTTAGQAVPIGYSVSCSVADPLGNSSNAIYKLVADTTISHYPSEAIAASCDPNWQTGANRQIDCTGFALGTDQVMC